MLSSAVAINIVIEGMLSSASGDQHRDRGMLCSASGDQHRDRACCAAQVAIIIDDRGMLCQRKRRSTS
ncbi:MAG: hypothetical protein H6633_13400 [Anaerolineales bacterium]|nr:hypothetical protein [Anaerolineales bacterium]